jgi:hypothetical protein
MQSEKPLSGSDWPRDMSFSISWNDDPLITLLYARDVWRLGALEQLPPLRPQAAAEAAPEADRAELSARWEENWRAALEWIAKPSLWTPELAAGLRHGDPDSARALIAPRWQALESLELESLATWRSGLPSIHALPLDRTPERIAVKEVVAAWRDGMTTIAVLPIEGLYHQWISNSTILLSLDSYLDPNEFRLALKRLD